MRESVGINKREVIVFGMEWIIFGVKGRGETNQRCKVPGSSPLAKQMLCACVCVCARACACACSRWCPNLCNLMDCSPLGSSAHGIFQARILESVAISFSRGSSQPGDRTHVSCVSCIGRQILSHQHNLGAKQRRPSQFLRCLHNLPQNQ